MGPEILRNFEVHPLAYQRGAAAIKKAPSSGAIGYIPGVYILHRADKAVSLNRCAHVHTVAGEANVYTLH